MGVVLLGSKYRFYVYQRLIPTVLSGIFAILWSTVALPHTLGIQYVCLTFGVFASIFIIKRNIFNNKNAIPLALVVSLFLWALLHLFFIGQNFELQLAELDTIWKRALLGSIFALGLGISLSSSSNIHSLWPIIILGLAGPTFIFYLKYLTNQVLPAIGLEVPLWLGLYKSSAEFYVPKISYVFFCIPCLAVSVGMIVSNFNKNKLNTKNFSAYIFLIVLILGLFYLENIKNGIAYSAILIGIGLVSMFRGEVLNAKIKAFMALFFVLILAMFVVKSVENNQSWKTLAPDLRIALKAEPFDSQGYILTGKYPLNENGVEVQPANYARFAWGIGAIQLIRDNPLGYGLVQSSFGHLIKQHFPSTGLAQSHSGWLDLALGIGVPGATLVLVAGILAINNAKKLAHPLNVLGPWFLGASMLLWTTTEVSQKNYLNTFIWMIIFVASLSLGGQTQAEKVSE